MALLAVGDQAVLSHLSAAWLWGLVARRDRLIRCQPVGDGPRIPGVTVHRACTLTAKDVRIHQGLPVTSPRPRAA